MVDKERCFVIMPFSGTNDNHTTEYWTRHFGSYLKPLIESIKRLEAFRSEPLRGNIASQIITDLADTDIVIADLTDHNPNVLWELGVRQSFKHCTITIAEVGTSIPFHFSHKGILFYNGDHLNNEEFERQLKESLRDCIKHPDAPDSPVIETLGGRGTLYSIIHKDENQRKLQTLKMELIRNEQFLKQVHNMCEKNKSLRSEGKQGGMVSFYLRYSAVEFLYINRYLDLKENFYKNLYTYLNHVDAVNSRIEQWYSHPEQKEEWLLNNTKKMDDILKRIEKDLLFK